MWKNSEKRFNVLWRRWLRESEGGAKILLFWASHNCQMPCAKIKSHGIEEGLESWCLVRLTPSHAWRSKEKNSRDLVLGRDNQNSLAHGQWQMICKVVSRERQRGQELGKPRIMPDKKDFVGDGWESITIRKFLSLGDVQFFKSNSSKLHLIPLPRR